MPKDKHNNPDDFEDFALISGTATRQIAEKISGFLGVPLCKADTGKFPNGESRIEILESVRGRNVFIIQSTCPPVNDNLMELFLIIDAVKRASARTITAVIPYFGYSKQDKKKTGREPISAKLVADLIAAAGCHRVITIDLHAPQIEGFFNIPVDNLSAITLIAEQIRQKNLNDMVVVAPDAGGAKRARSLANMLDARLAIIDKYRRHYREADAMNVVGKVEDMNAVIIEDFIDTGSTIVEAVKALKNHKARKVIIAATHPIHTDPATERLREAECDEIIVTDTIPLPPEKKLDKIKVISVAGMLAETIRKVHRGESVAYLFHHYK